MTLGKLVRSLLLNLILTPLTTVTAEPAEAAPRLQIQEVELVGYRGQALRVQVDLSCGSELFGLVVRAAKGNRLEIAAAVLEGNVICTSMPEPKEIVADFISTAGYSAVAAMAVDPQNPRLTVARTSDVKLLPASIQGNAQEVEAIYQTRCGTPVGTLIRRASANRLEVGFAERISTKGFSEDCRQKQVRSRVAALNPAGRYDLSPLPEKPASLARSYDLRFAALKQGSLVRGTARGVDVTYKRACNEAPVGLAIDDKGLGADGKRHVEVGMVVAHYDNFVCPQGRPAVWDTFGDEDVRLTGKNLAITLKGPQANGGGGLGVKTPTSLALLKSAQQPGLTVTYIRPCADQAGLLYTRDADDKLSIGVLMTSRPAGACAAKGLEVSLYQPFLAERVRTTGVMPLRLKGLTAR